MMMELVIRRKNKIDKTSHQFRKICCRIANAKMRQEVLCVAGQELISEFTKD